MGAKTTLKITIADDDTDDLEYLKFLFEKHENFEIVHSVTSASAVIESIDIGTVPDVLLTDFYMPVMNGGELTQYLIDSETAYKTHIFIISTDIDENQQEIFSANPNVHFLLKPTNLTEVNNIPGTILEKMGFENPKRI